MNSLNRQHHGLANVRNTILRGTLLCWVGLLSHSGFAKQQILIDLPAKAANASSTQSNQSLYQVTPLAPDVVAALHSANRFAVLDAQGNSMPMHHETVLTKQTTKRYFPAIYNWEDAKDMARFNQQAKVDVRVNGSAVAIVAQTEQQEKYAQSQDVKLLESGNTSNAVPTNKMTASKTWLVVLPKSQNQHQNNASQHDPANHTGNYSAILDWLEMDQKYTLSVSGSDDLVNWVKLKESVLVSLNAKQKQAALSQSQLSQSRLLESRLSENKPIGQSWVQNKVTDLPPDYAYWRLSFSKPMSLKKITLSQKNQTVADVIETPVEFTQTDNNTWQLDLPKPWQTVGFRFNVPAQQVWQMTLSKQVKTHSDNKPRWHTLATTQLFHHANTATQVGNASAAKSQHETEQNTIHLNHDMATQTLQLQGHIPAQKISAKVITPKQRLIFLAQGQAPYQLVLFSDTEQPDIQQVNLPAQFVQQPAQSATLSTWQGTADAQEVNTTRWLFWLALVLVMMVLMWMAYRLVKNLDADNAV